jgi:hypothetical protein
MLIVGRNPSVRCSKNTADIPEIKDFEQDFRCAKVICSKYPAVIQVLRDLLQ